MGLTIIVKSYQRPWLLGICLESVRKCLDAERVIIADDGTAPELWREAARRYGYLWTDAVHSEEGKAKWDLCKEGRFEAVRPTCGKTWNAAQALVKTDTIFLIEDDSYMTRRVNVAACVETLRACPELLCLIGLRERCDMEQGIGPVGHGPGARTQHIIEATTDGNIMPERFLPLRHHVWPWSFDGIFYRHADWGRIGPWPEDVATGPMEGFVQTRLQRLDWTGRPYGVAMTPFCCFDSQSSCRTDHPSTYAGRFRHVDACNAAWLAGWNQTLAEALVGLRYPRELRLINFVTGHELCGELNGADAD